MKKILLLLLLFVSTHLFAAISGITEWFVPLNGDRSDSSVVTDRTGNIYVSNGRMLYKYAADGSGLYYRELGSNYSTQINSIAIDKNDNIFVVGATKESLEYGYMINGYEDIFVAKYNSAGDQLWIRQYGSSAGDLAVAVAVIGDHALVTGYTYGAITGNTGGGAPDVFVSRFDANGNRLWTRQFPPDYSTVYGAAIAVDQWGDFYVAAYGGSTEGMLSQGLADVIIYKFGDYDYENPYRLWSKMFGGSKGEWVAAMAIDADRNIFIAGYTDGELHDNSPQGDINIRDVFLMKLDSSGVRQWTKQFEGNNNLLQVGVTVDTAGDVYLTGGTNAELETGSGNGKIFVMKFDTHGNRKWAKQFGAIIGASVAVDSNNNLYISGYGYEQNGGYSSPFLAKIVNGSGLFGTLNVKSSGATHVLIMDNGANGGSYGGTTDYSVSVPDDTTIQLTAPISFNGASFDYWDGCNSASGPNNEVCNVKVVASVATCLMPPCQKLPGIGNITAHYTAASKLNVKSSGASAVPVSSSTGHSGTTDYTIYGVAGGTSVEVTAPIFSGGKSFSYWTGCDSTSGTGNNICMRQMPYCKPCPSGMTCTQQCSPDWEETLTANYASSSSSNDCLFDWAEDNYPTLFSPSRQTSQVFGNYILRTYSQTGSYLAFASELNGRVYYFAPHAASKALLDLGLVSTWKTLSGCPL